MSGLSDIVEVTITRQAQPVSAATFSIPLILGESDILDPSGSGKTASYASLSEMVSAGWSDANEEYKAAAAMFSQDVSPNTVIIGRVDTAGGETFNAALDAILILRQDWYAIVACTRDSATTDAAKLVFDADFVTGNTIDGKVNTVAWAQVPFNTDHDTTASDLETAIGALAGVTCTLDAGDPTNRTFDISVSGSELVITDVVVAGGASQAGSTVNYGDDIIDVAQWALANEKLFITALADTAIKEAGGGIAKVLKDAANDRAAVIFYGNAAGGDTAFTPYAEAALIGKILPKTPGSYTAMFKTLATAKPDVLTSAELSYIWSHNANSYNTVAGINILREGQTAEGTFIDTRIGVDWLAARIQERIYQRFVDLDKIPFTDAGAAVIEGELRAQLDEAIDVGFIAEDPAYTVTVPKVADVDDADKANRLLPDIEFEATEAGAIHKTIIRGRIVV